MRFFLCFVLWSLAFGVHAQKGNKSRLALEYFNNGEYEKALSMYESLYKAEPMLTTYFQQYVECLVSLDRKEEAIKITEAEIKNRPEDLSLLVSLGNLYDKSGQESKSEEVYQRILKNLKNGMNSLDNVAKAYTSIGQFDRAIGVYEQGRSIVNDPHQHSLNLAELYRRKGNAPKMIENQLMSLGQYGNIEYFLQNLDRLLKDDDLVELQNQVFVLVQNEPQNMAYPEILQWSYIKQKEYKKAFRQAKSVDFQQDENGVRVYKVGEAAFQDEDYDMAIEAFGYVVETKNINSSYYLPSKRGLLNAKKNKVTRGFDYQKETLISLQNEYQSFLDEYGKNTQTALLMIEYADFEALYMNDLPKAREILQEVIGFGGLQDTDVATAKLKLGDYYLMEDEVWESTLLYSQVDKTFKEGVLGEDARYRNAMLAYYTGDFEWAQTQFDVLKVATSRLISNNAIDMDVFLLDNLGTDTIFTAVQMFAQAQLYLFQNKFDQAFLKLDSITVLFPEHTLADDILYTKAQIYKKKKDAPKTIEMYNTIIEKYKDEIKADNAIYELAKMYEFDLNEKEKAKALYEKLFLEYTSSTFAADARKRFRVLRGDDIQ